MENQEIYFGDSSTFAIRYKPEKKYIAESGHVWYYGFLHLVLNGQLIGSPDESCSVMTWIHNMHLFVQEITEGRYLRETIDLSIDETTDAYLITITDDGSNLKFSWKGWRMPCPKELRNILFSQTVSKEFAIAAIKECLLYVQNDLANYIEIPMEPRYAERNAAGENFLELLDLNKQVWAELTFRKIACGFARLAWEQLDATAREGLRVAEQLCEGTVSAEQCRIHHQKLQCLLPEEGYSAYSPVLWALHESTAGFPAWFNAKLAAMNIYDLKVAGNDELCAIILQHAEQTDRPSKREN